jgi:3-hydroxybutyrate dehydrogenase
MPTIKTKHGVEIFYKDWGQGQPIGFSHGWPCRVTHKAAYVAAEHGLVGLTKVVGLEPAGSGVACNTDCPDRVRTPMVEKQISDSAAQKQISQKEAAAEIVAEKQPSVDLSLPHSLTAWRHRLPLFGCGRPDHGHGNHSRWRLDRTIRDGEQQ